MPIYEYSCRRCGRRFETLVTPSAPATCPGCGATDQLDKLLSVFAVGATSQAAPPAGGCAAGQCHSCPMAAHEGR